MPTILEHQNPQNIFKTMISTNCCSLCGKYCVVYILSNMLSLGFILDNGWHKAQSKNGEKAHFFLDITNICTTCSLLSHHSVFAVFVCRKIRFSLKAYFLEIEVFTILVRVLIYFIAITTRCRFSSN